MNMEMEELQMESLRERKKQVPTMVCGMESYVEIGAGEYTAFIYINQDGDLIIVPEFPTEGFKKTVIHNVGAMYEQYANLVKKG